MSVPVKPPLPQVPVAHGVATPLVHVDVGRGRKRAGAGSSSPPAAAVLVGSGHGAPRSAGSLPASPANVMRTMLERRSQAAHGPPPAGSALPQAGGHEQHVLAPVVRGEVGVLGLEVGERTS